MVNETIYGAYGSLWDSNVTNGNLNLIVAISEPIPGQIGDYDEYKRFYKIKMVS